MENILVVKDLSFEFGDKPVLKQVNMEMPKASSCFLLGENGSGKSTLLNLIYGKYDASQGNIWINGEEVYGPEINLVEGREGVSYVNQFSNVEPFLSVRQNLKSEFKYLEGGYTDEAFDEIVSTCLIEDLLDEKVKTLSGGEKQRVSVAKALVKAPDLILFDEPFNHLDYQSRTKLKHVLIKLKRKQVSLLVVTHDVEEAKLLADEVFVMDAGELKRIQKGDDDLFELDQFEPKVRLSSGVYKSWSKLNVGLAGDQAELINSYPINEYVSQCLYQSNGQLFELTLPQDQVADVIHVS